MHDNHAHHDDDNDDTFGMGDDQGGKVSDEDVKKKADEKAKEEGCEFC